MPAEYLCHWGIKLLQRVSLNLIQRAVDIIEVPRQHVLALPGKGTVVLVRRICGYTEEGADHHIFHTPHIAPHGVESLGSWGLGDGPSPFLDLDVYAAEQQDTWRSCRHPCRKGCMKS